MNRKPPSCGCKENLCVNLTSSATWRHHNLEKRKKERKKEKITLSVWCYPIKFITQKMTISIPVKGRNRRCMQRKTILAVHSHLFTSKCRTFHKCAGYKKIDVFFIPKNVARFTRITFEKRAGLHVKCPLILFVFDTLWMHRICYSKSSNKPGLIVVFSVRHEYRIYVAPYCV